MGYVWLQKGDMTFKMSETILENWGYNNKNFVNLSDLINLEIFNFKKNIRTTNKLGENV